MTPRLTTLGALAVAGFLARGLEFHDTYRH